ncbi:hypothetical protein L243_29280 [Salmonella enterica subsp. enterica serovar Worthington str. BCH-3008]|nr:hypothetical protein L243_29280 [Salmonella enterica subsp. enterica serovar Worthington str. BCH-3008]
MHHFELGVRQCFHFYLHRFFTAGQIILRTIPYATQDRRLDLNQTQTLLKLAREM